MILFELLIVAYALGLWWFMRSRQYRNVSRKFILLFISILLFEIMSEPMWRNIGYHSWAYVYHDITWVLTLGWVGIFMTAFVLIDRSFTHLSEKRKFWLYLLFVEVVVVPLEAILLATGVRDYAPVLRDTMSGLNIPFTPVPLEVLFAVPLFAALIIAFYKYVNHLFDEAA